MGIEMSDKIWRQVNSSPTVIRAEKATARKMQSRAQAITNSAGGKARITIRAGIRPGGRSRVNVVSDSPAEEYGTETQKGIRALGRAKREV